MAASRRTISGLDEALVEDLEVEQRLGRFNNFSEVARRAMVLGLEVMKSQRASMAGAPGRAETERTEVAAK